MVKSIRDLGVVKLTQLQPSGLIIETPSGHFYDPSRRLVVDSLTITPLGIEATTSQGERVLDIHHLSHPDKAYDDDDLVCIGFTSHYAAMRQRFGEHMVDGIAGENIIIEYEDDVWSEDIGDHLGILNPETGKWVLLDLLSYAEPCSEFSHFTAQSQDQKLPADQLKFTLQFLGKGRRGFLLVLSAGQDQVVVKPGDKVYAVRMD